MRRAKTTHHDRDVIVTETQRRKSAAFSFGSPFALPRNMTTNEMHRTEETRIARMIRELQSDMADLVASGDLTETEANDWVNRKADQWAGGMS